MARELSTARSGDARDVERRIEAARAHPELPQQLSS
jgi:hypothetical protein